MRSHYPKPCLKPHFFLENIRYLEEIYLIVHWVLPCHALILSHNPIDVNYVLRRSRKRNKKLHGKRKILMFMYTYSHFTFRYTCCIFSLPIIIDFGIAFISISHFPCRSHWKSLKLPENSPLEIIAKLFIYILAKDTKEKFKRIVEWQDYFGACMITKIRHALRLALINFKYWNHHQI